MGFAESKSKTKRKGGGGASREARLERTEADGERRRSGSESALSSSEPPLSAAARSSCRAGLGEMEQSGPVVTLLKAGITSVVEGGGCE